MNAKLVPPTVFYTLLLLSVVSHIVVPTVMLIRPPYSFILGLPLILFGACLNIWADALFKKRNTPVKPMEMPVAFVTDGPFRISRHPMYLGMAAILLGVAVLLGSILPFTFPILFVALMERLFVPLEEENLERAFGDDYRAYKQRVRRWI
ncbi:MAG: isoprenylcysteine carboxylmethyltransferase family protein [Methanomicrobia archaeon]|nr:isoprenylcysteine carboxylmethyltransferase family protein [Methanomicrobia archaeon]